MFALCYAETLVFPPFLGYGDFFHNIQNALWKLHFQKFQKTFSNFPASPGQGSSLTGPMPELRARRCWAGWKALPNCVDLQPGHSNRRDEGEDSYAPLDQLEISRRKRIAQQSCCSVTADTAYNTHSPAVPNAREVKRTQ